MHPYETEMIVLQLLLDGLHNNARMTIRQMTKQQLQKLSDALDYYAVLVDDQLIKGVEKR